MFFPSSFFLCEESKPLPPCATINPRRRRSTPLATEMEPAGPSAKKLKLAASELQEAAPSPAAVAAEATDPKPPVATEGRHEPPPGAEEESMDRITNLPDAVLEEIISLLPTNEGARTQALASRWRHLWHSAPLNLDLRYLPNDVPPGAILSDHQGRGRRLCLCLYLATDLDDWIRSPVLDDLQELEIYIPDGYRIPSQLPSPPASIFRFSSTLRVATIAHCSLPDQMVETLRFPQLRKLAIVDVDVSEGSLQSIITSCCPALECLLLGTVSFGCSYPQICSPALGSIGTRFISGELIIEGAPTPQNLLHLQFRIDMQISVVSAPKLETLSCISELYVIPISMFGSRIMKALGIRNLTTVVHAVKILAIHMSRFNLDKVIELMECFPCLEKLYMKDTTSGGTNRWRRKHRNLLRSLDIRLKTIVLRSYRGFRAQVNFATFFVLNARVLESIRLEVQGADYNEVFFAAQHRKLQMEKRASRGSRLTFTKVLP